MNKKGFFKKGIAFLGIFMLMLSAMSSVFCASAEDNVTVKTIIGNKDGRPFDSKTYDEFYNQDAGFFVWFNVELNTGYTLTSVLQNVQCGLDAKLKKSALDCITLNGKTVRQINTESDGNNYAVMVAYEKGEGDNTRISFWLSWGATGVNNLFNKDIGDQKFTLEFLDGMQIPGTDYVTGRGPYKTMEACKFEVDFSSLEYGQDLSNPYYDKGLNANGQDESTWMCPLFWNFTAKWVQLSGTATTGDGTAEQTEASATDTTAAAAGNEDTPSETTQAVSSETVTDSTQASGQTSSGASAKSSSTTVTSAKTTASESGTDALEATETSGGISWLVILLIVIGVIVIAAGVVLFIVTGKKKNSPENE